MYNLFSFWLIPENKTFKYFRKIIKSLSIEYNSPIFPPHITILGNIKIYDTKSIKKNSITLIKNIPPIRLSVDKPEHDNIYFQSLYLRIKKNNELLQLYHSLKRYFDYKNSDFSPHMSLFYGYLNKNLKKDIINRLNSSGIKNFVCDKIYLYATEGEVLNWKLMHKFYLKKRLSLKDSH